MIKDFLMLPSIVQALAKLLLSKFQAPRKIHKAERTLETLSGLIEISGIHVRSH